MVPGKCRWLIRSDSPLVFSNKLSTTLAVPAGPPCYRWCTSLCSEPNVHLTWILMTGMSKFALHHSSPDEVRGMAPPPVKTLRSQLLGGSLTLLAGSGLVGVTNLVYNVTTARLLGPAGFAHATSVYTILMLMSAITLSFQVVCAKYVANHALAEDKAAVFARLHQRAWIAGVAIGLLLFLPRHLVTSFLNLPDPILISLLALGTAFYIPLGVRRGYIQAIHSFGPLAVDFLLGGVVRLLGGLFLI